MCPKPISAAAPRASTICFNRQPPATGNPQGRPYREHGRLDHGRWQCRLPSRNLPAIRQFRSCTTVELLDWATGGPMPPSLLGKDLQELQEGDSEVDAAGGALPGEVIDGRPGIAVW